MKRRRVPAARSDSFTPPRQFDALWLRERLQAAAGSLRAAQICVAFSGGLDSTALVAALHQLQRRERLQLRALHVNHHLQPGADDWASQARARTAALGIDCRVIDVTVPKRSGSSLEAEARAVRYAALRTGLLPGEWLLTAHHQDDQLETVLLQLLRGAGLPGLAAMPARVAFGAGWLLRPLLPVSRAALVDYLARRKLPWTDDPSNADPRFDRNYLRHEVLPALQRRWPAAAATVSRSAAHIAEAQSLLDAQADALLATALDGAALRVPVLRRLSALECRLAVRRWLRRRGLPIPERSRLQELVTTVLAARPDAAPVVRWEGAEVRRHGELLHAMPPLEASAPQPCRWHWRHQHSIALPGAGRLQLQPDPHGNVDLDALPATLEIRFRSGGERLAGSAGRKPLKNLLQELAVPPWQRGRLPLLYAGRQLLAVADLWIESGHQAGPGCKRRARLSWEPKK